MAKNQIRNQIDVRADYHVHRGAIKSESGLSVKKVARAIFDTAANDSSGVSNKTVAAHGLGVFLPTKAIITRAWYQVVTALTSTNSTATVALSANGANDIKTATAVADATFGTTGFKEGISDGTAAQFVQCSAERELIATVAVQALLFGKLVLHVEYRIGD